MQNFFFYGIVIFFLGCASPDGSDYLGKREYDYNVQEDDYNGPSDYEIIQKKIESMKKSLNQCVRKHYPKKVIGELRIDATLKFKVGASGKGKLVGLDSTLSLGQKSKRCIARKISKTKFLDQDMQGSSVETSYTMQFQLGDPPKN